jgi:hypothetical protein
MVCQGEPVTHPRRCECCRSFFEHTNDPRTAGRKAEWRCPKCNANPPENDVKLPALQWAGAGYENFSIKKADSSSWNGVSGSTSNAQFESVGRRRKYRVTREKAGKSGGRGGGE